MGLSGGFSNLIPFIHVLALAGDVAFLLHKMSFTCWGIGTIMDCVVTGKDQFHAILQIWTGTAPNAIKLVPVSNALYLLAEEVAATAQIIEKDDLSPADTVALAIEVYFTIESSKRLKEEINALVDTSRNLSERDMAKLIAKRVVLTKTLGTKISRKVAGKVGVKLGAKLAQKLATRIGARIGGKLAGGTVPVAGALFGAGVNVQFINSIAKSAEEYYKLRLDIPKNN